jgi:hypothetical protein
MCLYNLQEKNPICHFLTTKSTITSMTFNASVRHYEPRGHLFNIKNQLTWRYFTQILSRDASQPVLVTSPNWNIPLDTSIDEEPISSALRYQEFQNTAIGMSPTDNSEKENYSDAPDGSNNISFCCISDDNNSTSKYKYSNKSNICHWLLQKSSYKITSLRGHK